MNNQVMQGDCLELLKSIPDNSVTAIITDPPYELGFMGKGWDKSGIANNIELWRECLRVLKPGGYLLSFGGTRTFHRMACAIEDAGFEIRDMVEWLYSTDTAFAEFFDSLNRSQQELLYGLLNNNSMLHWVYGSGFPKSHNIGIAVDKLQGNERVFVSKNPANRPYNLTKGETSTGWQSPPRPDKDKGTSEWEGWGTATKPSHEPICMARKPLSEKTVAENCLKWGTGGINIDRSRVGTGTITQTRTQMRTWREKEGRTDIPDSADNSQTTTQGRFPANLIHDGSDEVKACFPDTKSGKAGKDGHKRKESLNYQSTVNYADRSENADELYGDSGNASRFFKSIIYTSKVGKKDRGEGNTHPTVKPIALMEYLINMVSREGDTILDPFGGSGTTAIACLNTNRKYILMEKEKEYIDIINKRINEWEENNKETDKESNTLFL